MPATDYKEDISDLKPVLFIVATVMLLEIYVVVEIRFLETICITNMKNRNYENPINLVLGPSN